MRRSTSNQWGMVFVAMAFCFGLLGCNGVGNDGGISTTTSTSASTATTSTTATTTSTNTTTTSTATTTTTTIINGTSTGNFTFTVSFSPTIKVGVPVAFNFVEDDPDASVEYVCSYWSFGDGYYDHIPCQPRGSNCPNTGTVYTPVHGHVEYTNTYTYTKPGTYNAYMTMRSGDLYGCSPYSDDAHLSFTVVVVP